MDRRTVGLGNLGVLNDQLLLKIFSYFKALDLISSKLLSVSHAFYIFSCEEDLWRDHVLNNFSDFVFKESWRLTMLHIMFEAKMGRNAEQQLNFDKKFHIEGFYSAYLSKRWYTSHVNLSNFAVDYGKIERKSIRALSAEEFTEDYDAVSKPVLLLDVTTDWPATTKWTKQQLLQNYANVTFKVSHKGKQKVRMTLEHYIQYANAQMDDFPLYIFDSSFGEKAPALLQDYTIPKYFTEDYLKVLPKRPNYRWFVMGPMRSGSPWHVDPDGTSAWNGRKRWALYPPHMFPPGVSFIRKGEKIKFHSPSPLEWFLDIYPTLAEKDRPIECTQNPGETIFVPAGWWHTVLNLEAVTQNFVNNQNLTAALEEILDSEKMEDFELLRKHACSINPRLDLVFQGTKEKHEEEENRERSSSQFKYWKAITSVCKIHNLPMPPSKADVEEPDSGSSTNLVYICDDLVFKFYRNPEENSLNKELETYKVLSQDQTQLDSVHCQFPLVKAKGELELKGVVWPYIVLSRLEGDPIIEDYEELSHPDLSHIAQWLGKVLKMIHYLPIEKTTCYTRSWDNFFDFITKQRAKLQKSHQLWGTLSFHLLDQVESYVKDSDQLLKLINTERPPLLLHGDLTDENLIGMLEDGSDQETTAPKAKKKQSAPRWEPVGLIDFGDARVGDFLFELVPLHISCFHCDKKLLQEFLGAYGWKEKWSQKHTYLAMCYTLLHYCDALSTVYHFNPDFRKIKDLETLASVVWDLSNH